ncbi:MAG: hypothetical protein CM1200mP12_07060 [Gammaproteobacteria bacterium]|nr:MAG: hypothetical protein CM1200mP12_07060 [Gammaproteobacteria bacterium]
MKVLNGAVLNSQSNGDSINNIWLESNSNFQYSINGKAYIYAKYVMFFALTLNIAAVMPTYIKKYTKHPMSLGIAIWTVLHLLVNPDTASIILFGSFLAYSTVSVLVAELRESNSEF